MALNPTDYAVISQALIAATHEMGAKLIRSAYSTIVRDASDASSALLDRDGQAVAQAELLIQQLGSLSATFGPCAEHHPVDTLVEGDFYINNDPFHGGQHLPDVFIFSPIFFEGELMGFGATVAHHIDIGGGAPGLNMGAREIYQEGLIIPPSRYNVERDWNGGSFERLIATNIRVPNQTIGDMNAQFAGNAIGAARVHQLCRKYGPEAVKETMALLIDYSERRMRAAIAEVPDGTFHGEDVIDDDGLGGGPLTVRATVTINGDEAAVDFEGTSDQIASNMNSPFASTVSAAIGCVKAALTSPDIPYNAGITRPVTVTAPYGSLLNPKHPAPVRARMTATNRVFNAVMKALAQVVPDKVIATGFDTTTGPYLSRRSDAGYKVYHEIIGGGYGASAHNDGCSGVDSPLGNCSNAPVETLDMDFDYFRVSEYSLIQDSGGGGEFRGGLGVRRRYEILKDDVQYAQYGDRFQFQPEGLFAGEPGSLAYCTIERGGEISQLKSKESAWLQTGDVLTVNTGGGGGYGSPTRRAGDQLDDDVEQGKVSPEAAAAVYGADIEASK
jgi:N-methylhydantoinase B